MSESRRFRVLFVCIGNSCRSPMAEAIANHSHGDVLEASSAGVAPAPIVQALTFQCLAENGIPLSAEKRPQKLEKSDWASMDVIVNISGQGIAPIIKGFEGATLLWDVIDPIGLPMPAYREARDRLEKLVDRLASQLRGSRA